MARLIYAVLALAFVSLVAGFLVRDTSAPLLASIGLSGLSLLLFLIGTSRNLRRTTALDHDQDELAELEMVEMQDTSPEETASMATIDAEIDVPSRPRRSRRRRATGSGPTPDAADATTVVEPIDEPLILDSDTEIVEPRPRPKRASKARPAAAKAAPAKASPATTPARRPAAKRTARASVPVAVAGPPVKVWVIPGRSRYHTQSCRFAKGDDLREVTETTAIRRGYVACNVCNPGSGAA